MLQWKHQVSKYTTSNLYFHVTSWFDKLINYRVKMRKIPEDNLMSVKYQYGSFLMKIKTFSILYETWYFSETRLHSKLRADFCEQIFQRIVRCQSSKKINWSRLVSIVWHKSKGAFQLQKYSPIYQYQVCILLKSANININTKSWNSNSVGNKEFSLFCV